MFDRSKSCDQSIEPIIPFKMAANVQSMCQYWKNFDLQELQRELDTTATDLANRQDESDASRRKLVELSREFKKNTPEDIRKIVAPLLKSFQGEVDFLSKRSKAAEAAFLSVYKRLIDLPDPVPALEQALQAQKRAQRVQDLEIENKQLRETLEDYNNEFAEVKNQEVTIKQLKEKLREYEDKLETTAEARAKEKERELQKLFAEKERQLQETQLSVARKLGEAEQKIASLQSAHLLKALSDDESKAKRMASKAGSALESVQSELFEVKSKYDEATTAKSDEMDIVMADLERANERAASAEREAERLRQQLTSTTQSLQQAEQMRQAPDMEQALEILSRSNLQVELAAKEKEVAQLVEDVQRLQAALSKLRETSAAQIAKLEEELASKNKAFRALEDKLRCQEDYEEIKRELGVLKSIEFSSTFEDDDKSRGRSLEVLLLEKNKALQNENTQLKVSTSDLSGPASAASAEPSSSSLSPAGSHSHGPTNAFAQMVGEELAQSYRPESSSRSTTPATSTVRTPPDTPLSLNNHILPPTPTSVSAAAAAAASAGVLDTRHFPVPPPSPFYGYAGLPSPFHPAFMPVNMVKAELNSAGALDTTYVAKNVRELLAIHNIGQRLFAKHVLGLSQGTVSELLSKPKSWDKLTEKGRESYRKMHAWATDDSNIMALKAISPKKGSQSLVSNPNKEDSATEDRIASILNEAQQAMQAKKSAEQQVANAVVNSIYQLGMSRMAAVNPHLMGMTSTPLLAPASSHPHSLPHLHHHSQNHTNSGSSSSSSVRRKKERDVDREVDGHHVRPRGRETDRQRDHRDPVENSQDMVARIYRQELEKLKQAADSAGNMNASNMYQQELERLAQQQLHYKHLHDVAALHRLPHNGISIKAEPPDSTSDDTASQTMCGPIDLSSKPHSTSTHSTHSSSSSPVEGMPSDTRHAGSAFFLVRPRMNGHDSGGESPQTPTSGTPVGGGGGLPESLSPLQRMQNIANSLTSRPHLGMPSNKPLRSVLPPITQEEFDRYSNINTEDLVKKVKETLSQYSISQRLFGENVLGLSQGSVSDLLARPKPWHMLTQKGREPFIRMQIFLNDTEAIPKLVSSQYRIPPDKLMRSNSRSDGAHRRRKSSADERGFDSPTQPKRPRVFFTEEQKDALRAAYQQDPYPNQSTIEQLASDLGVGIKTVINWFHNHRMRAKQQHHSGGSDGGESGGTTVKSEPADESSNQSDMSSISGDATCHQAVAAAAAAVLRQTETSQWMFPQFEPVPLLRRKSSEECGVEEEHDREGGEDKLDEPDGSAGGAPKQRDTTPGGSGGDNLASAASPLLPLPPPTTTPVAVNKRKRSNPQRVYEGTQLDRTQAPTSSSSLLPLEIPEAADATDDLPEPSTNSPQLPVAVSSGESTQDSDDEGVPLEDGEEIRSEREERIKKLQQGLRLSAADWEEGEDSEGSAHGSVGKVQHHTDTNSTDEEWGF